MNNNASKISCDLEICPKNEKYAEKIRQFQGCPTIAVTKGGRIFLGWYSGGSREPHMENYNLVIYSDDGGKTWSEPALVIASNKEKFIHALDIQLWISPEGKLYVFWVQNNTEAESSEKPEMKENQPYICVDGYQFYDCIHAEWVSVCDNPDAEKLEFSQPRYIYSGFLRCKPLVLNSGRWLAFNYDQTNDRYGYSISDDNGETYKRCYGQKKLPTFYDETMAYEKQDGSIRMLARTSVGYLAECTSYDNGITWSETIKSNIENPETRFFVARTPGGRILLINNDHKNIRCNMTVYLSEDDGKTWKYKRCIDERENLSYPDADFHGGRIYLTYDRGRCDEKEILFTSFTEEDIMNENYEFDIKIVSKAEML